MRCPSELVVRRARLYVELGTVAGVATAEGVNASGIRTQLAGLIYFAGSRVAHRSPLPPPLRWWDRGDGSSYVSGYVRGGITPATIAWALAALDGAGDRCPTCGRPW